MNFKAPGMNGVLAPSSALIGIFGILMALAASMCCDAVAAQEQAAPAQLGVEEVVVSARRRDENLQQVPLSVSALSSDELAMRGITNIVELNSVLPNLVISGKGPAGGTQLGGFFIRGIGSDRDSIADDPRVAVYLDGVYLGSAEGTLLDVLNLKRVEVLRGPQGTLFGKNALAGAIQYVSQEPAREFGGDVKLTIGSYERIDVQSHLDVPLSDTLLSRVAALSRSSKGYGENILTGEDLGDIGARSAQAELLWSPSQRFTARFAADYTALDNNGPIVETISADPNHPVYSTGGPPRLVALYNQFGIADPPISDATVLAPQFKNRSTTDTFFEQDIWGVRLNLDWQINDALTARSLTSYREWTMDRVLDLDGSQFHLLDESLPRDLEQAQQELQLQGSSFGERLTWVLGVFYFASEYSMVRNRFIACELGAAAFPPVPVSISSRFRCPGDDITEIRETDSFAGYGEATYDFNKVYSLTAGLRWSREDIFDFGSTAGVTGAKDGTFEKVTPRVSLQAQWTDDLLIYVSYSEGFRSGGQNNRVVPGFPDAGFRPYDPETLESYEIGLKWQTFDDRLRVNVAGFSQDWKNIQLPTVPPASITDFILNAGSGKVEGFELEATARVGAELQFNISAGHIRSGYEKLDPGVTEVTLDTPLSGAPEWTFGLGAQWDQQLSFGGSFATRIDYGWQDERLLKAGPLGVKDDAYGMLRARATYVAPGGGWSFSVFGTNLTDERYLLTGFGGVGQILASGTYGRPREWGADISITF
jgi:iron complex outermembrane recepter protein